MRRGRSGGPRLASNPANAILNYFYALLEAETTIACYRLGLDPGIGIFHVDRRERDSLALDIMEAVRPTVDAYVLALLTQRTLARGDFVENRQGVCSITPRLATRLADTITTWARHVAPVVEGVAHTIARRADGHVPLTTPLTRANHQAAWDQRAPNRRTRVKPAVARGLPATCRDCGTALADRAHRYCDECRPTRWQEDAVRGRASAASVLAQLRAEQRDPAHGGRAAVVRGKKNAAHQRAVHAWEGELPDPAVFRDTILPALRNMPIARLAVATGLSDHYCSLIRLGKKVPHARHWPALRALAA